MESRMRQTEERQPIVRKGTIMLTATIRAEILNKVIAKVGAKRALEAKTTKEGVLTIGQNIPNPYGFDGVDKPDKRSRKFRARIRFTDALSGQDVRLTLGSFDSAEEAGYAYAMAHIKLWGSASRYNDDNVF